MFEITDWSRSSKISKKIPSCDGFRWDAWNQSQKNRLICHAAELCFINWKFSILIWFNAHWCYHSIYDEFRCLSRNKKMSAFEITDWSRSRKIWEKSILWWGCLESITEWFSEMSCCRIVFYKYYFSLFTDDYMRIEENFQLLMSIVVYLKILIILVRYYWRLEIRKTWCKISILWWGIWNHS